MYLLVALAADNSNGAAAMTQGELIAWIAGIATAVATVVTAAMTLWFRMMDKPSPEFEVIPLYQDWQDGSHGPFSLPRQVLTISNVGSGPARIVSFIGAYASIYATDEKHQVRKEHLALFDVGQTIEIAASAIPSRWEQTSMTVTWAEDSHLFGWRSYKYKSFKLSELFDVPLLTQRQTNPTTGVVEYLPVSSDSPLHKEVQQLESELEKSGTVVRAHSNWYARHKQLRKLSKAGWRWRQYLTKTSPDETE